MTRWTTIYARHRFPSLDYLAMQSNRSAQELRCSQARNSTECGTPTAEAIKQQNRKLKSSDSNAKQRNVAIQISSTGTTILLQFWTDMGNTSIQNNTNYQQTNIANYLQVGVSWLALKMLPNATNRSPKSEK